MASTPPPPPPAGAPTPGWQALPTTSAERVRVAYQARAQSDYVFTGPGLNIFLTLITCGIFGLYLFYQLMRRDRDHLLRRYQLLDAANAFAWERANADGLAGELTPAFERTAVHLESMRRQTTEFRDPAIWLLIALVAGGIAQIIGFILLDQDLDAHDRTEGALETELASIYARLGHTLPIPDPSRVKGKQNYAARIVVTIVTCGVYELWWLYDMQVEGNRHLEENWPWDDAIAATVQSMVGAPPP
jgi:Domain of unknown function (DUF4234)